MKKTASGRMAHVASSHAVLCKGNDASTESERSSGLWRTSGFAKGAAAGALALLACAGVHARSVSVSSVSNDVATLNFGAGDGKAYKLAVARGQRDAGDVRSDWDAIEIIGDVADGQTSATWSVPKGEYRYARFFLFDANLPFTKCLAMVQSDGTQYIDTGVRGKTGVRADLDVTVLNNSNDVELLGAYGGSDPRFYLFHFNYRNSKFYVSQVLGAWVYPSLDSQVHSYGWRQTSLVSEVLANSRALYQSSLTPAQSATVSKTFDTGKNLYLIGCNGVGNIEPSVKFVRGKIWENVTQVENGAVKSGTLVRDFIPVEADGQGALFDLVSRAVYKDKSGTGFAKGVEVPTPVEVYQTSASSETVEIRPMGTLIAKRDFLNDPSAMADTLSLPRGYKSPRTVVVRFKAPAAGAETVRPILQLKAGNAVVLSYSLDATNALGAQAVSLDAWHTLTVVGGPTRLDCYLDETKLVETFKENGITALNGVSSLVFGDGNAMTDDHIQFASAEVWSVAGVGEGRLAAGTKSGMVGEWTFPADNPLRATKGQNLEGFKMQSDNNFTCQSSTDGVVAGDAKVYVGTYHGFRCRHGLPLNSDYSVVVDVRVPSTSANGIHGVFQASTFAKGDCNLFLRKNADKDLLDAWVAGSTYKATEARHGEWCRAVLTYANDGNKTVYVNGKQLDVRSFSNSKINGPYCYFGIDNNGEDNDIDISYAAMYDRVLTAAEVAEFHCRPTAHASPSGEVLIVPELAGLWERQDGALVSQIDGAPALAAQAGGGYTWTQESAPAGMTVVVDFKPPYHHPQGGVILANADGVATGIYGTGGTLNGCLATTTASAIFASGADTDTAKWGGCTYEPLRRGQEQRVAVTWDAQGRVRYYVNGQLISQQDTTAANTSAQPSATMTFLVGFENRVSVSRLAVYNGALTPIEVASLGGFEMVPPTPGSAILLR